MSHAPFFFSSGIFVAMNLIFIGAFYYLGYTRKHARLLARIEKRESRVKILKDYLLKALKNLGQLLMPDRKEVREISLVRRNFFKAGYRHPNVLFVYLGAKCLLAALLPFLLFLLRLVAFKNIPPNKVLFLGVLLAVIGFYLPGIWLHAKIAKRKERILKGFPDALDLLVVSVNAGMSLDAAISRVGEEITLSNKDLAEELQLLNLELLAGKPRYDALKNLALRTDLEEIDMLTALLIQTDRFGTSIARALMIHSDSMRTRRYQKAEEIAARLPVKLLFPLILFIFPAILVVLLGPPAIKFLKMFGG